MKKKINLFHREAVIVEELVQLLVGVVDAQLLEAVDGDDKCECVNVCACGKEVLGTSILPVDNKVFKAKDVQHSNEFGCLAAWIGLESDVLTNTCTKKTKQTKKKQNKKEYGNAPLRWSGQ